MRCQGKGKIEHGHETWRDEDYVRVEVCRLTLKSTIYLPKKGGTHWRLWTLRIFWTLENLNLKAIIANVSLPTQFA